MSLEMASRSSTQEIIATADPTTPSLDCERSHRASSLAIPRLTTRVNETRLRSQNAQMSRPNEQIDSKDKPERPNEHINTPPGADDSSYELSTSNRIANVTSQLQTSSELGNITCSSQNLWREPQSIPNCKTQVYVYPYSNSVIQEDYLKRFPVVIDIFKRNIEKMSELKLHMCEIDYTLKMCGSSPITSHPSIIIFCTKAVFPSLRSLLTSRHVASQYYLQKPSLPTSIWRRMLRSDEEDPGDSEIPRFKIYFWWAKKMPRTLHWGRLENLRVYQPCHDSLAELEALTMCGSKIAAADDTRLATLGCLVKIQSSFYGLSASHAFESIVRSTPLVIGTSVGHNPTESSLSVHSIMSQKVEDHVDDVEYDTDDDKSIFESIVTSVDRPNLGLGSLQDITEEIMQGNVIFPSEEFFTGTMKPDLDWALIEINDQQYKRPNAYIAVTEPPRPIFFSKAASCHPGEQRDIVVISSALNPRRGVLLPGKSFLGGINRPNMCEVWNILLTGDKVLSRGDSGSLVIDLNTNEVYGHVVASNPLGEAYVVPLLATLDQIRESFDTQDVSLPETLDFKMKKYEAIPRKQTLITEPDALTALEKKERLKQQAIMEALEDDRVHDEASFHAAVAARLSSYETNPLSSSTRHSVSYEASRGSESVRVEVANSGRRRRSGYEPGPTVPLTAETLRRQQRRHGGSSRSTKSSQSRDQSDYKKSKTRSMSNDNDEDVTIKVTGQARIGQARMMVGGAQINCDEGGEIEIKRQQKNPQNDGEPSNSEYGGGRRLEDHRSGMT